MPKRPRHRRTRSSPPAESSHQASPLKFHQPTPPPDAIDVIVYDQTPLESDDDIEEVAEDTMTRAFKTAKDKFVGDRRTYGNELGVALLQSLQELRQSNRTVLESNRTLLARVSALEGNVGTLEGRVRTLTTSSSAYRDIRSRFLDTFRRDTRGETSYENTAIIKRGNLRAHGGDCLADASLYTLRLRHDPDVLVEVYGLDPNQIEALGKFLKSILSSFLLTL